MQLKPGYEEEKPSPPSNYLLGLPEQLHGYPSGQLPRLHAAQESLPPRLTNSPDQRIRVR